MNTQITTETESYYCFGCKCAVEGVSNDFTCTRCRSSAVEEITTQNDPRKHDVPTVQPPAEVEEEWEDEEGVITQIIISSDGGISITFINSLPIQGPRDQERNRSRWMNIFRMLELFQNNDTPATPVQIQSLEKTNTVQCSVCQEEDNHENGLKLPCGHTFHSDCIKPWLQIKNTCPTCRNELSN